MLVSKFVLTRTHHHIGEKGDLGRTIQFRFSDSIKEEAIVGGKNPDLFIPLRFECLFGIKSINKSCFSLTLYIQVYDLLHTLLYLYILELSFYEFRVSVLSKNVIRPIPYQ